MLFGKLLPAWARLGPLSTSFALRLCSHRRFPASRSRGRSPKMGWRSGFPTGRPWDFAGDRADPPDPHDLRRANRSDRCDLPDPFLGSRTFRHTSVRLWPVGSDVPRSAELSSAVRPRNAVKHSSYVTCGDSNPTCL
jgi:hypothetical protein